MKKIRIVCVGIGNRGIIYSEFAKKEPSRAVLVGAVDPKPHHRRELALRHGLSDEVLFSSVDELVASGLEYDLAIDSTPDSAHFEVTAALLRSGHHVLMEKPITRDPSKLFELCRLAKSVDRKLFVCHLMRYTPFYLGIKEHILSGEIGKVVSIKMSEYVGVSHFIESFVVGKWRSEAECGSPFLLAKSCHDLDMLTWLNNSTVPKRVASFGSRRIFIPENAPKGHTETCHTCPCEPTCKYSLTKLFTGHSGAWKRIILDVGKPTSEVTQTDIDKEVRSSNYGRCVYEGQDLVDRQNVIVEFEDGSIGTFDLVGSVAREDRYIHVIGEDGEIFATRGDAYYTVRTYDYEAKEYVERKYDVSALSVGGHGGGDYNIMRDVIAYLNGEGASISMTHIGDSVNGHLIAYAAEDSRKSGRVVSLSEYGE